jgi:hypothetical protein
MMQIMLLDNVQRLRELSVDDWAHAVAGAAFCSALLYGCMAYWKRRSRMTKAERKAEDIEDGWR